MAGFNIVSHWGLDASGVGTGTDYAVRKVEEGAGKVGRAGNRMASSFGKSSASIYINKRKTSGAIVGIVRDMGNGMNAADAMANAMMYLGKGVRGAMVGMAAAGALTYMVKKFSDAKSSAKAMQETLDALDNDKLNAQNSSVKELTAQLNKYHNAAKNLKEGDNMWGRLYETLTGNGGQRAKQAAQAKLGENKMLEEVMKGQDNATKAAHLAATGRKKEAARQAFGVKRGGERADLEEGLRGGGAGEGEIGYILGQFDRETQDQLRAMGLRRIGRKGQETRPERSPLQSYMAQVESDKKAREGEKPTPPSRSLVPGSDIFDPDKKSWGRNQLEKAGLWVGQTAGGIASRVSKFAAELGSKSVGEAVPMKGPFTHQSPYGPLGVHYQHAAPVKPTDPIPILREIRDAVKAAPLIKMK